MKYGGQVFQGCHVHCSCGLVPTVMVSKGKGVTDALRPHNESKVHMFVCVVLPRVIPLGHWMSVATKTCLSTPFIPDFSILAGSPQSDQYRNLWDPHAATITGMSSTGNTRDTQNKRPTYPDNGSTAMEAGSLRPLLNRVFCLVPLKVATEMVLVPRSDQYRFL